MFDQVGTLNVDMETSPVNNHHAALVSVVVCAFNDPASLTAALKSISRQNYPSIEVLVFDDAGAIDLRPIVESFAARNPSIQTHFSRNEVNLGVARNKTWAFAHVKGEYCAFLEHDDVWIHPDFLSEAIRHIQTGDGVVAALGNSLLESNHDLPPRLMYENTDSALQLKDEWQDLDGQTVSKALLRPITIRTILLGRRANGFNVSWSSMVFRTKEVRESGELRDSVLISDEVAEDLSVYPNEESFMFLHHLLACGNCSVTNVPVSLRGRPLTSFSNSIDHPGRKCKNDVEVFNYIGLADRIHERSPAVASALRRRAESIGLGYVNDDVKRYLDALNYSSLDILRCQFYFFTHRRVRIARNLLARFWVRVRQYVLQRGKPTAPNG